MRTNLIWSVFSGLGVLGWSLSTIAADPTVHSELSAREIGKYFQGNNTAIKLPGDGIEPNFLGDALGDEDPQQNQKVMRLITERGRLQLVPTDPGLYWKYQNLFKFDVPHFNSLMGSTNFLDSKLQFYKSKPFDTELQIYPHPYGYINSWHELFHPPIKHLTLPLSQYTNLFGEKDQLSTVKDHPYFTDAFQKNIDEISGTELTFGNKLKLLANGSSHSEKLRFIRTARKQLWIALMVLRCDSTTEILADEIIRRHKEGLDVRIVVEGLYPDIGLDKGCAKKFEKNKVPIIRVSYYKIAQSHLPMGVMHHKFWVRDDEEAIVGGENLLNLNNYSDGFNGMRDTDVLVHGPAVTDMQMSFVNLWKWVENIDVMENYLFYHRETTDSDSLKVTSPDFWTWDRAKYQKAKDIDPFETQILKRKEKERELGLRGSHLYSKVLSNPTQRMDGVCRFLSQIPEPFKEIKTPITPVYQKYIENAQKSIFISSPHISFDPAGKEFQDLFYNSIIEAAQKRHVQSHFVVNGFSGGPGEFNILVEQAILKIKKDIFLGKSKKMQKSLLEAFVNHQRKSYSEKTRKTLRQFSSNSPLINAWTYFQYMHSKQALFDLMVVGIGSSNLDYNSSYTNYESSILCLDDTLRNQMIEQFTLDLINSIPTVSANGE